MSIQSILIVEDDTATRNALAFLLETRATPRLRRRTESTPLRMLRDSLPDAILLDLSMPRSNGWEFLMSKPANPKLRSIHLLVITASPAKAPRSMPVLGKPA